MKILDPQGWVEYMEKLVKEEERRLKVGNPNFLKRHEEIMKQCDELEKEKGVST